MRKIYKKPLTFSTRVHQEQPLLAGSTPATTGGVTVTGWDTSDDQSSGSGYQNDAKAVSFWDEE